MLRAPAAAAEAVLILNWGECSYAGKWQNGTSREERTFTYIRHSRPNSQCATRTGHPTRICMSTVDSRVDSRAKLFAASRCTNMLQEGQNQSGLCDVGGQGRRPLFFEMRSLCQRPNERAGQSGIFRPFLRLRDSPPSSVMTTTIVSGPSPSGLKTRRDTRYCVYVFSPVSVYSCNDKNRTHAVNCIRIRSLRLKSQCTQKSG